MKHYYAIACELEEQRDADGLHALAEEWRAQGFGYRVFGALHRATTTPPPNLSTSEGDD